MEQTRGSLSPPTALLSIETYTADGGHGACLWEACWYLLKGQACERMGKGNPRRELSRSEPSGFCLISRSSCQL